MRSTLRTLTPALLVALPAHAQWSPNPAVNLAVADKADAQVLPKVRSTSDGGVYISWFDNAAGGFDVYLQRLDADGVEQWPHNGVLVADRNGGMSQEEQYGLVVDGQDHALLAYRVSTGAQVFAAANRVSPAGAVLWGPGGVQVSSALTQGAPVNPKVCATSDGFIVVAWTSLPGAFLQRLDAAGAPQWAQPVSIVGGGQSYNVVDVVPGDDGSVIVALATGQTLFHAQKFSADGQPLWGAAPPQVGAGTLPSGFLPPVLPDGDGGAVFAWHTSAFPVNAHVQRISAAGVKLYGSNGLPVVANTQFRRMFPSIAFNQTTGDTYCYWIETNTNQTLRGVYAQKISDAGVREWTDNGRPLTPLLSSQLSSIRAVLTDNGSAAFWIEQQATPTRVVGARLDPGGGSVWPGTVIRVGTSTSTKAQLDAAIGNSVVKLAWQEARLDINNIYAQNVEPDGSPACYPDCNTGGGGLTVADFICFQSQFSIGHPYADCNQSGTLTAADFVCFQTAFVGGCP